MKNFLMTTTIFTAFISVAGCKSSNANGTLESAAPPSSSNRSKNLGKLSEFMNLDDATHPGTMTQQLPDKPKTAVDAGIASKATVEQHVLDSIGNHADALSIKFLNVTESQFNTLKTTYSGWSATPNQVKFSSLAGSATVIKSVPINAFLPPLMQALLNRVYKGPIFQSSEIDTTTNCWSTVYEVIRSGQSKSSEYTLFFGSAVQEAMTDNRFSKAVTKQNRAPGDILVYSAGSTVSHVAILIDKNLVFEKPDYGSVNPFRLRFIEDSDEFKVRRWKSANISSLPSILDWYKQFHTDQIKNDSRAGIYFDNIHQLSHADLITGNERIEYFGLGYDQTGMASLRALNN